MEVAKRGCHRPEDKIVLHPVSTSRAIRPFDVAGVLFDIDRSQAQMWMHRLQPILEATLGEKMALPERKLDSVEAFIERFPRGKAGHD